MNEILFELIMVGLRVTGNPIDALQYIEEDLSETEFNTLKGFMQWCSKDWESRKFGYVNYNERYQEYSSTIKNIKLMGLITHIQWCDSTGNIQMGCEGCELVKGQPKTRCYAHQLTNRYAGRNGWPTDFLTPKLFLNRLDKIVKWSDLTGTTRPDKPWLNEYPRVIFLNDMGDTFSNGMPKDWFAEVLPRLAASPHIYMLLTKFPQRLAKFSEKHPLPRNIWVGTSVTSDKTAFRAEIISNRINGGGVRWLSVEPMWTQVFWENRHVENIDLYIFGGESGSQAKRFEIEWLNYQIEYCRYYNKACFIKQLGSNVYLNGTHLTLFTDGHAGDWNEWPDTLKVRQFPPALLSLY